MPLLKSDTSTNLFVFVIASMWVSGGGLSPSRFLSAIRNLEKAKIGDWCLLDAQCSWIPNAVCAQTGKCDCQYGKFDGAQCERPPSPSNKTEVAVSNSITESLLEDMPGVHHHHSTHHYRRPVSHRLPYHVWYHSSAPQRHVGYNPDAYNPDDPSYWGMNGMGNGMGNMNGMGHGMGNGMPTAGNGMNGHGGHGMGMGNMNGGWGHGMGNGMGGMNGWGHGMGGMNGWGGMNGMNGMGWPFGMTTTPATTTTASGNCLPSEVEKNGDCYRRKKPGEFCEFSEQCMTEGGKEYYCINNMCQPPPDCPPGHAAVGSECLPQSVTDGPCSHPIQCLSGSVCIDGICRGPCDRNEVFVEEVCVDYEGAGCVAVSCATKKCPKSYPACNYIPQKDEYLCCDKPLRLKAQCPDPHSAPQLDPSTGAPMECLNKLCAPGYKCTYTQVSGRTTYICCSNPRPEKPTPPTPTTTTPPPHPWGMGGMGGPHPWGPWRHGPHTRRGRPSDFYFSHSPHSHAANVLRQWCCANSRCRAERDPYNEICDRFPRDDIFLQSSHHMLIT